MERTPAGPRRTGTFSYRKGQSVFAPGDAAGLVYIVRSGCVRLVTPECDGRAPTLGFLGPDAVYAQAPDDPLATEVAAVALVDSTVTAVTADNLPALVAVSPALAASVVARSARRRAEPRTPIAPSLTDDVAGRLAATLVELAEELGRPTGSGRTRIDLPLTDDDLADVIGADRPTVGRLLGELRAAGAIQPPRADRLEVDLARLRRRVTPPADGAAPTSPPADRDLPSQERLLEALRESEARFRVVWNETSDAIALSDPDGVVLAANPAYAELYGYPLDQVVGQSFAIIFPAEQREWALEQYRSVFHGPMHPPPFETTVRRADGAARQVVARVGFVERGDERVAMVSVIREIDDRRAERRSA